MLSSFEFSFVLIEGYLVFYYQFDYNERYILKLCFDGDYVFPSMSVVQHLYSTAILTSFNHKFSQL